MAMNTHVLYAVDVNGTLIDGITNQSVGLGVQKAINRNDGSPHPRFAGVLSQKPTISVTTKAIAKALGVLGNHGAAISANVTLFFYKTAENGLRASGSSHLKLVIAAGLVVPRVLRASQDQEAELTFEIFPISSDGSTAPIAITDSQALAGTPNSAEKFTLGPAKFNGTNCQPQSLEIDFGLNVETKSHSGFVFPVRAHVATTEPMVKATSLDMSLLATLGLSGAAQGSTDSVFYVRKLSEGGTRVADGTTQHVSITVDEGIINPMQAGAGEGQDASLDIELAVTYDGSNDPLVLSTSAAIS